MGAYRTEVVGFNGNLYLPLAGGTMTGSILVSGGAVDLGAAAARFRSAYVGTLDVSTAINGAGDIAVGMSAPAATARGWDWTHTGGVGGAGGGVTPGGRGGNLTWTAGVGGAGSAGAASGNGGNVSVDAGPAGLNNGGGSGTNGTVTIAGTNASGLFLGSAGINTQINGTLRYDNSNTANDMTPGAVGLGTGAVGYIRINVGGVVKKVPFWT